MASEEQLVFALELDADSVTEGATDSADALEKLKEAVQGGTASLREMQGAMRNLKGSALASDETVKSLKDRIAATKATLAANTLELVKNKGAFAQQPRAVDQAAASLKAQKEAQKRATLETRALEKSMRAQESAIKKSGLEASKYARAMKTQAAEAMKQAKTSSAELSAQLKPLTDVFGRLKGLVGAGGMALGVTLVATAFLAVATAAVAATAALVGYAIAQADARRSDLLRLEGLSKVRNYWLEMVTGQRRAADSAQFLQSTIDGVASGSALSRDRVSEMTDELYRAGLRGQRLKDGLEGLAIVEATQGKESAAAFKARALGAALYGTSIKALSNDVKARLGGVAKAQMLSLDVQSRKARENISHLFDGIKIESFLEGLSKITEMFSQSTASGRALKKLVETMLQPLIDSTTRTGPIVKKFFQGIIIGALSLAIIIYKVRNALRDAFGDSKFFSDIKLTEVAVQMGIMAFGALMGVLVGCTALVVALGAAVAVIATPFIVAGAMVYGFIAALEALYATIKKIDWKEAGSQVTDGMYNGITLGAPKVLAAVRGLGGDVIATWRKALDMHSPSRRMAKVSYDIPTGAAQGVDKGAPLLRKSVASMADAAEQGMRAGGGGSAATGARGAITSAAPGGRPVVNLTIENLTIGAGQSAEQIKDSLREAVEEIFERTAHTMGASV